MAGSEWWKPRWGLGMPAAERPDIQGAELAEVGPWHGADETVSDSDPALLALQVEVAQIRSKGRVRDLAEVFTNQREVGAMLDLIPDAFEHVDIKFLEPACGSGNFLVEIMRRKLARARVRETVSQEQYEHLILRALASTYGVDISPENIADAHVRVAKVIIDHFRADAASIEMTPGFIAAIQEIIHANIVVGDTLNSADRVDICDWQPRAAGCFQRVWSRSLVPESDRDLIWELDVWVQDRIPVHYSNLSASKKPIVEGSWT